MKPIPALLFFLLAISSNCFSQKKPQQLPLWANGAPGFEHLKNEPEEAKDWWVKNIHNPSMTVYYPEKAKVNGTAVLICPGGGHRTLVYNAEGKDAAEYLNSLGITAFVLKYRPAREENSPYKLEEHARQDAYRAIRTIRHRATDFEIDPAKVGVFGFSAGGEVVTWVAYGDGKGEAGAADPIDKLNDKPDFQMLVYPGPLGIPDVVPAGAPPAFMVVATNDECCSEPVIKLLLGYRRAGASVEAHIYAKGEHAFNMGERAEFVTLKGWPERMKEWLIDSGYLNK